MDSIQERIAQLEDKIRPLLSEQEKMNNQILVLLAEIRLLRDMTRQADRNISSASPAAVQAPPQHAATPAPATVSTTPASPSPSVWDKASNKTGNVGKKESWEDKIGTNLINRIGILVTIIGVFIGAKYAIDKNLISPAMRIVFGYSAGLILAFLAFRLKKNYHAYSAVLMSGAVSIFYFITFTAFAFYGLFSQPLAFGIMLVATVFGVGMALWYDKPVIALMGQVGAYAIPFLLSTGSGNIAFLLAYLCIVNSGLLFLSFRKNWKLIYQVAFVASWVVFLYTYPWNQGGPGFSTKLSLLLVQFVIFHTAFLCYKMLRMEAYKIGDIGILLMNALLFFMAGYDLVHEAFPGERGTTLFTAANAAIHLLSGFWAASRKLVDTTVHLFLKGLGITFLTILVPVAFNGNTITVLWAVESLILLYVANRAGRDMYHQLSNVLLVLMVSSMVMDWQNAEQSWREGIIKLPFLNRYFLSSLFAVACTGVMGIMVRRKHAVDENAKTLFFDKVIPLLFIILLYLLHFYEIRFIWISRAAVAAAASLETISLQCFTLLYLIIWSWINQQRIRHRDFAAILIVAGVYTTLLSLTVGLSVLGDMRSLYLTQYPDQYHLPGIRYALIALLAIQLFLSRKNMLQLAPGLWLEKGHVLFLHGCSLVLIGNEFIHWMDLGGYKDEYKLGISIISGLYALFMLVYGIMRQKQYLRIAAIALLGMTLVKVFLYDLSSLSTISKTLVLISLGVILLIASFLYNRYKHQLFGTEE